VKESPDVAAAVRRFYEAFVNQRRSEMTDLLVDDDALLLIGSNDAWVRDRALVLGQLSNESQKLAPRLVEDGIVAYELGNVGWAADRPTMFLPNGFRAKFRITCVLCRDAERWRIVQSHLSVAVPDEDLFTEHLAGAP